MQAFSIRPDIRTLEEHSDFEGTCRKCGKPLVLLPGDVRHGYCFDCIDFLDISRKQEINDGRIFTVKPSLP